MIRSAILFVVLLASPVTASDPNLDIHRWNTKNFVIISMDESQGEYLFNNVENIKTWILTRWGFEDIDFPNRTRLREVGPEPGCMIVCVKKQEQLEKIFNKDRPHLQIGRKSGKIILNCVVIVLNDKPTNIIPPALTLACLAEVEEQKGIRIGHWAKRGMGVLNSSYSKIHSRLKIVDVALAQDKSMFFSASLFSMREDEWKDYPDLQKLYDAQAAVLCLLLRKEHGQRRLHEFFTASGSAETKLKKIYKFENYDDFDSCFKRYMRNLTADAKSGKIPESYLQITPVR